MSQPRCCSGLPMLKRRTSLHSGANTGPGRSQLLIQAFQASNKASSAKPGKSAQGTAVQRALARKIGAGRTPVLSDRFTWEDGADPIDAPGTCNGALLQAASIPTIRPINTGNRSRFMRLPILEALGALALLLLIVWWTMFSGRNKGELAARPEPDKKDQDAVSSA